MQLEPQNKRKLDYKWVVMAVSFLMVFTTLGFCSSNKSLYLKSITAALGIPRSLFSISDSCRYITTAILNLFFGALLAKFGGRKLIGAGFVALIGFCLFYASANNIYTFYAGGVCLGIGMAWTTTTIVGYAIGKWFPENRGTIMGIVLASNGLGTIASTQIVTPLIHDESVAGGFGYRNAYYVTAVILAVVGLIVLIFFREAPKNAEKTAAVGKKKKRGRSWVGMSMQDALRKPYFYLAAVCIFLTGASLQSVSGVSNAHLEDVGLDTTFISTVFSLYALLLAASKVLTGISFDKLGLRITMLICDSVAAIAIFLLSLMKSDTYTLAVLYEVLIPIAMPLETVMLPLIAADMFGEKAYAKIMGLFVSINTAGYAVGAPLANLAYDLSGSYKGILTVLAVLMALIAVATQISLSAAGRDRKEIEAAAAEA